MTAIWLVGFVRVKPAEARQRERKKQNQTKKNKKKQQKETGGGRNKSAGKKDAASGFRVGTVSLSGAVFFLFKKIYFFFQLKSLFGRGIGAASFCCFSFVFTDSPLSQRLIEKAQFLGKSIVELELNSIFLTWLARLC